MIKTERFGLTAFTAVVPAYAHGFSRIDQVRYAPSECYAELEDETRPVHWQPIDYLTSETADLVFGARPLEQAIIEITGEWP